MYITRHEISVGTPLALPPLEHQCFTNKSHLWSTATLWCTTQAIYPKYVLCCLLLRTLRREVLKANHRTYDYEWLLIAMTTSDFADRCQLKRAFVFLFLFLRMYFKNQEIETFLHRDLSLCALLITLHRPNSEHKSNCL